MASSSSDQKPNQGQQQQQQSLKQQQQQQQQGGSGPDQPLAAAGTQQQPQRKRGRLPQKGSIFGRKPSQPAPGPAAASGDTTGNARTTSTTAAGAASASDPSGGSQTNTRGSSGTPGRPGQNAAGQTPVGQNPRPGIHQGGVRKGLNPEPRAAQDASSARQAALMSVLEAAVEEGDWRQLRGAFLQAMQLPGSCHELLFGVARALAILAPGKVGRRVSFRALYGRVLGPCS